MLRKKFFVILIFIISCSYFLDTAYAINEATVYLTSNQVEIEKGEEVEITVNIEKAKTAAYHFSLYYDETKLEFISDMESTNVIENQILFVWFDSKGGEGAKEGELVKFRFRAKEDGLATFNIQGEFYSENGQKIQTNFKETQLQIGKEESILHRQMQEEQGTNLLDNNANLQSLRLDKEGITPNFDKEIYEYYLIIPIEVEELEILAISENPKATIEIQGNKNLQEGLNDITVRVISADGMQNKVYTIHVTKTLNLESANSNLEILAIENILLNPPFSAFETNYRAEVSNDTQEVNVFAVAENEEAVVEVIGKDNLKEGNNIVTVQVTAPNGFTKKKYQVVVYKRNPEEESQYQQEQAKRKEELENAYKIEETSLDINKVQEERTKKQGNKYQWIVVLMIGMTIGIVALAKFIRRI